MAARPGTHANSARCNAAWPSTKGGRGTSPGRPHPYSATTGPVTGWPGPPIVSVRPWHGTQCWPARLRPVPGRRRAGLHQTQLAPGALRVEGQEARNRAPGGPVFGHPPRPCCRRAFGRPFFALRPPCAGLNVARKFCRIMPAIDNSPTACSGRWRRHSPFSGGRHPTPGLRHARLNTCPAFRRRRLPPRAGHAGCARRRSAPSPSPGRSPPAKRRGS